MPISSTGAQKTYFENGGGPSSCRFPAQGPKNREQNKTRKRKQNKTKFWGHPRADFQHRGPKRCFENALANSGHMRENDILIFSHPRADFQHRGIKTKIKPFFKCLPSHFVPLFISPNVTASTVTVSTRPLPSLPSMLGCARAPHLGSISGALPGSWLRMPGSWHRPCPPRGRLILGSRRQCGSPPAVRHPPVMPG